MRNRRPSHSTTVLAGFAALALACLAGCSRNEDGSSAFHASPHAATQKATRPKQDDNDLHDMVAAVAPNKAASPVEVKFALAQRPEVGQPLNLDVAVMLVQPLPDSVTVAFQSGDGIEIIEGADPVSIDRPAEGTPIRRTVKLLPQRDG